jgi:hypothetical protein
MVEEVRRKGLTDLLGPLRRWLQSQVGRAWNDVYSEIARTMGRCGSWGVRHILSTHLDVAVHTYRGIDGNVWVCDGQGVHKVGGLFAWILGLGVFFLSLYTRTRSGGGNGAASVNVALLPRASLTITVKPLAALTATARSQSGGTRCLSARMLTTCSRRLGL